MRLIEERRGSAVISYVYEPDSYVPLARLDAQGKRTEQVGLGTTQDVQQLGTSKTIAASAGQTSAGGQKHPSYSQQPANDTLEASYWQALNPKGTGQSTGTDGPSANANLCEVYYFHTDQVGLPEELSNAQDQIIWQAQYKTWGSTVEERWEARRLHGAKVQGQTEGDIPQGDRQEQNLRFQGQYLDRETGLHYNTFRYYDADIGRFISPDPIGLEGGMNLGSYSPNPISWIDPWGWACAQANQQQGNAGRDALAARLRNSKRFEVLGTEIKIRTPGHTTPTGRTGSRNADIVVRDRKTNKIMQVEVKTGNATRSPTQASKDAELATGGGSSGKTTWGTRKIEKGDPRITKGDSTGPINTVQVTVDPATGKILR